MANQTWLNKLYYGDNLDVIREHIPPESVDLIYLDPPFNSNRTYNVIFGKHQTSGNGGAAQIQAFGDTWTWTPATDEQYLAAVGGGLPLKAADALTAFRTLLGENDAMAYLVNMAPRLVELHRVLKPSGSLYLHCDPTMSHYLKMLLDAIFGAEHFRSEIIWRRYGSHNDAKGYDADGRRWREQNLVSPNPRPNLTYAYTALNGVTYSPPPNGWKVTPERMAELDAEGRLLYPAKADGRLRLKNYLDGNWSGA